MEAFAQAMMNQRADPERDVRCQTSIAGRYEEFEWGKVLAATLSLAALWTRRETCPWLAAYAGALRLQNVSRVSQWLGLSSGTIWVTITFGHVGSRDLRNTFQAIFPFDAGGWSFREYDYG